MSYSQLSQDVFVYNFFDQRPGFYLELGCNDGRPRTYSNCLFLEERGWTGIGIDVDHINEFNSHRKGKGIQANLINTPIQQILKSNDAPEVIEYLSYDCDQALKKSLEMLDLTQYKFKLIHFEHNDYINHDPNYSGLKESGQKKFLDAGYELIVDNLIDGNSYAVEDWYIHPELVKAGERKLLRNIFHRDILSAYGYRYDGLYHHFGRYFN